MATTGGEERKGEAVAATLRARSVAGFAIVHGAVLVATLATVAGFAFVNAALFLFLTLERQNAERFYQCMEACPALGIMELISTLFMPHPIIYVTICVAVVTGMLSIRLFYTILFGSHCCFSGGIVHVAFAVAVVLFQAAISFCGGWVIQELALLWCPRATISNHCCVAATQYTDQIATECVSPPVFVF